MELGKGIQAHILLDSVNQVGNRLTTFILKYPRFIHAETMTYRVFSRSSASSRAIPTEKLIKKIEDDPAMPVHWGKNQKGMQAREEVDKTTASQAEYNWLLARDQALKAARHLSDMGIHKQVVNRLIEPWMHIIVLVSSTSYANFFHQRAHPDAQPEIADLAYKMKDLYEKSQPQHLAPGEWHLPFITEQLVADYEVPNLMKIAVGRCARVSYMTYDGLSDPEADIALHDRLYFSTPPHASPFEHVAQARGEASKHGNFTGFLQYRQLLPNENVVTGDMWMPAILGWPDDSWKGGKR